MVRIDLDSGDREVVGRPGVGLDNLALDPDDRIFVSSFMDGSIVEVTGPETNREVLPSHVNSPGGLAYTPSGRLFLGDGGALRELDPSAGALAESCRLVLDADYDLVIVEGAGGRFVPLDDRETLASGLEQPAGIAAHGGDVYVTDRRGFVLQVLAEGEPLASPRQVAAGLAGPEGIAAAADGGLFVVEVEADRVSWVNPESGDTVVVAEGLAISGPERRALGPSTPIGELSGIAVGEGGTLYVSAYRDNRVYRIEL